jgi:HD-GYP domain-containing protein (c-di-GMP phosphodiesterase class II)/c-di-GMP-binding flagellar brake protein YcgR
MFLHENSGSFYSAPHIDYPDFTPVKVRSLFTGGALPCDFFFPALYEDEIRLEQILARGELYSQEIDDVYKVDGTDTFYIRKSDEQDFLNYIIDKTQEELKSEDMPDDRKIQLLYDSAEAVVKKVCRERPDKANLNAARRIVGNIATCVTSGRTTVTALLSLFSKDYYTFSHSVQVATLGMAFGHFLGWGKSEISDFGFGALFHDLGKNSISDEILNKPGKLEKHEYETIKGHPFSGYQQLKKTKAFSKNQLDTILYHHEATNGSGYPEGLSGIDIPYFARVAHVVDVFDALTSARVYKPALSRQDSLALMRNEMPGSFDTKLFGEFIRYIGGSDSSKDSDWGELKAGLGTLASIQSELSDRKAKSIVIGMEREDFIILRISNPADAQILQVGTPVVIRYIYAGEAYGFEAEILEMVQNPAPLPIITYPSRVEKLNLRSERRHDCLLPASIEFDGNTIRCVTVNLSYSGCRVFIRQQGKDKFPPIVKDKPIIVSTDLPGRKEPICLRGQIKNKEEAEEGHFMGIRFADVREQSADNWKDFIDDILELTR